MNLAENLMTHFVGQAMSRQPQAPEPKRIRQGKPRPGQPSKLASLDNVVQFIRENPGCGAADVAHYFNQHLSTVTSTIRRGIQAGRIRREINRQRKNTTESMYLMYAMGHE